MAGKAYEQRKTPKAGGSAGRLQGGAMRYQLNGHVRAD
jgi:hypothetical protein